MTKDFKKQAASDGAFGQYGLGWMVGGVAIGLLIGAGMYALANKGNAPSNATTPTNISSTTAGTDVALTSGTTTPGAPQGTAVTAGNGASSLQDVAAPANEPREETPGFSYHAVLPQLEVDVPPSILAEQRAVASQTAAAKDKAAEKKAPAPAAAKEADKKTAVPTAPKATDNKTAAAPPAPPAATATPTGFNGFQIGSYKTKDQATDMQNRLKKNGLNSRVEQANVQGATWFRVRLGPASSPDMLDKWQQTLSGMGISPLAVRM